MGRRSLAVVVWVACASTTHAPRRPDIPTRVPAVWTLAAADESRIADVLADRERAWSHGDRTDIRTLVPAAPDVPKLHIGWHAIAPISNGLLAELFFSFGDGTELRTRAYVGPDEHDVWRVLPDVPASRLGRPALSKLDADAWIADEEIVVDARATIATGGERAIEVWLGGRDLEVTQRGQPCAVVSYGEHRVVVLAEQVERAELAFRYRLPAPNPSWLPRLVRTTGSLSLRVHHPTHASVTLDDRRGRAGDRMTTFDGTLDATLALIVHRADLWPAIEPSPSFAVAPRDRVLAAELAHDGVSYEPIASTPVGLFAWQIRTTKKAGEPRLREAADPVVIDAATRKVDMYWRPSEPPPDLERWDATVTVRSTVLWIDARATLDRAGDLVVLDLAAERDAPIRVTQDGNPCAAFVFGDRAIIRPVRPGQHVELALHYVWRAKMRDDRWHAPEARASAIAVVHPADVTAIVGGHSPDRSSPTATGIRSEFAHGGTLRLSREALWPQGWTRVARTADRLSVPAAATAELAALSRRIDAAIARDDREDLEVLLQIDLDTRDLVDTKVELVPRAPAYEGVMVDVVLERAGARRVHAAVFAGPGDDDLWRLIPRPRAKGPKARMTRWSGDLTVSLPLGRLLGRVGMQLEGTLPAFLPIYLPTNEREPLQIAVTQGGRPCNVAAVGEFVIVELRQVAPPTDLALTYEWSPGRDDGYALPIGADSFGIRTSGIPHIGFDHATYDLAVTFPADTELSPRTGEAPPVVTMVDRAWKRAVWNGVLDGALFAPISGGRYVRHDVVIDGTQLRIQSLPDTDLANLLEGVRRSLSALRPIGTMPPGPLQIVELPSSSKAIYFPADHTIWLPRGWAQGVDAIAHELFHAFMRRTNRLDVAAAPVDAHRDEARWEEGFANLVELGVLNLGVARDIQSTRIAEYSGMSSLKDHPLAELDRSPLTDNERSVLAYMKGGALAASLEWWLGRERFLAVIRAIRERHQHAKVRWTDIAAIVRAIDPVIGARVASWIALPGAPDLHFEDVKIENGTFSARLVQTADPPFSGEVEIGIWRGDEIEFVGLGDLLAIRRIEFAGPSTAVSLPIPANASTVEVDPLMRLMRKVPEGNWFENGVRVDVATRP